MKKYILLVVMILTSVVAFGQVTTSHLQNEVHHFKNNTEDYKELQKYMSFKNKLDINLNDEYLEKIRNYSKDSLKTLAIKLLSIKELKEKQLLKKDISLHTDYYINLLEELKTSEIHHTEYDFLEKELAFYIIRRTEKKYVIGKVINYTLGIIIVGMVIYGVTSKRSRGKIEMLSKQEKKIKKHIIEGKTNKEIAQELFISLSTVKTHISNIYNKLHVSSRNELISKFGNHTRTST